MITCLAKNIEVKVMFMRSIMISNFAKRHLEDQEMSTKGKTKILAFGDLKSDWIP